jgi:hypothetical protein
MTVLKRYNSATLQWEPVQVGVPGPPGADGVPGPPADPAVIADLTARVGVISNFASPNAGGIVIGQIYDNSFQGTSAATVVGVANRIELAPYYTSSAFTADRLGVRVTMVTAGGLGRILVYGSSADGWPDALLFQGSVDLDMGGTTGFRFHEEDFVFERGKQYWVGIHTNSVARYSGIATSSAVNLGLTSPDSTSYATVLRRTLAFASGAPSSWAYVNADRASNASPPSIRLRVKSLP